MFKLLIILGYMCLFFSRPTESELNKIRKYYKLFGFEIDEHNTTLNNVYESNTIAKLCTIYIHGY